MEFTEFGFWKEAIVSSICFVLGFFCASILNFSETGTQNNEPGK